MRLVDTNVLIYAVNSASDQHVAAKTWLDGALSGGAPVGFAWLGLIGFVRLTTQPTVFDRPLSASQAMDQVEAWLAAGPASVLQPGAQHAGLLRDMLGGSGARNLTNDAHVAALAVEHKATVMTFDSDFDRFPGVRWDQPR